MSLSMRPITDIENNDDVIVVQTTTSDKDNLIADLQANIENLTELLNRQSAETTARFTALTTELEEVKKENAALVSGKNIQSTVKQHTKFAGVTPFVNAMSTASLTARIKQLELELAAKNKQLEGAQPSSRFTNMLTSGCMV